MIPDGISVKSHLDLQGRKNEVWFRRAVLVLIALVAGLALLNVFGQRPDTDTVSSDAAVLTVYSPERVRGGLLFTTRFSVEARRALKSPALILDPGWVEGMQVNSVTPQPRSESSDNGDILLRLDDVAAGTQAVYFIEFQVNPTNIGRRSQNVRLTAEGEQALAINRDITILP
jgi:hypothetical protein